jgi:hypothetical protein
MREVRMTADSFDQKQNLRDLRAAMKAADPFNGGTNFEAFLAARAAYRRAKAIHSLDRPKVLPSKTRGRMGK